LAHAFLSEYGYKGLKLAQLLGQLGVFLTRTGCRNSSEIDEAAIVMPRSCSSSRESM
jgi:hypothetical protein